MTIPKLFVLCGLPASGKSTYAKELANKYDANIHASDSIREELSGDINNQNINDLVFKTLHRRVKDDLANGKNCIYDATNINYKRRMAFLQELNKIPCEKICILMATPYEECLKNNANRERKVPEEVIERMYRHFDVPDIFEGWRDIQIVYAPNSEGKYGSPYAWIENYNDYNQENTHHCLTLGEHCLKAYNYIKTKSKDKTISFYPNELEMATLLHDCGKPFCKTFTNNKGKATEQAHYYNHERCGAYDSLFYDYSNYNSGIIPLYIAILIRLHMMPYFWEKDNNEKMKNKYRNMWGYILYDDIMLLHEADKNAH